MKKYIFRSFSLFSQSTFLCYPSVTPLLSLCYPSVKYGYFMGNDARSIHPNKQQKVCTAPDKLLTLHNFNVIVSWAF